MGESRLRHRGAVIHLRAVLGGQRHFLAVDGQQAVLGRHCVVAHCRRSVGGHWHTVYRGDNIRLGAVVGDRAGCRHHHIEHMVIRGSQICMGESRLRHRGAVIHLRAVLGGQRHFLAVDGQVGIVVSDVVVGRHIHTALLDYSGTRNDLVRVGALVDLAACQRDA